MNLVIDQAAGSSPVVCVVSPDDAVVKELVESVDKMISAISSNQSVQTMANNLAEKNWWGAFKGNLSGANDKDIASMVKNLGGSLETTQAVVQVMLRLQTQKVQNLRGFHSTLVDKIIKIQADTKTLGVNQRAVALDIVSALNDQIKDQLDYYDAVERHERQLQKIDKTLISSEENFREHLKALDAQCASLKKSDDYLSCEVEEFQVGLKALAEKSAVNYIEAENQARAIQEDIRSLEVRRIEDVNTVSAAQEKLRKNMIFLSQWITSATKAIQVSFKELSIKNEADLSEVEIQNRLIQTELRSLEVKCAEDVKSIATVQENLRNDVVFLRQRLTSATGDFSGHINHQITLMVTLEARLTQIESEFARNSTWSARLLRHSFGIVGILIGIAGLAISLYRS